MKYKNPKISRLNSIQTFPGYRWLAFFETDRLAGVPGPKAEVEKSEKTKTKRYFNPVRVPAEGEYKVHVVGELRPIGYG